MLMGLFVVWVPPAPDWPNQKAFEAVFYVVPRFVLASLVAFWLGEFTNSYTLAKMKLWTDGKWLWTRTVGSTIAGQFVDTTIVILIAFGGRESWSTILSLIFWGYLAKVIYEALATPITYWIVNNLKRAEGIDVYDRNTNFNPFARNREAKSICGAAISERSIDRVPALREPPTGSCRLKIISGGQTGVDRAALDAALKHGIECGGWCPAGRLDEFGRIPDRYPVKELEHGSFVERTMQNVKDSDGTVIIYFGSFAAERKPFSVASSKTARTIDRRGKDVSGRHGKVNCRSCARTQDRHPQCRRPAPKRMAGRLRLRISRAGFSLLEVFDYS